MSLFGNYGKAGSSGKNGLFPSDSPVAAPKVQAVTVTSATPIAPVESSSEAFCTPCEKPCGEFRLDITAQFGMCKCGFDRKSHEGKQPNLEPPAKVKSAPSVVPQPAPVQPKSVASVLSASASVNPSPAKAGLFGAAKATVSAKQKGAAALLKGFKSGEVTKLVDGMEATSTTPAEFIVKANEETSPAKPAEGSEATIGKFDVLGWFLECKTCDAEWVLDEIKKQRPALYKTVTPVDVRGAPSAPPAVAQTRQRIDSDASTRSLQGTPSASLIVSQVRQRIESDASSRSRVSSFADSAGATSALTAATQKKVLVRPTVVQTAIQSKSVSLPQPSRALFAPQAAPPSFGVRPAVQSPNFVPAPSIKNATSLGFSTAAPNVAQSTGDSGPCGNFQVDLASTQFGMCRCGFDRPSHSSLGVVNQTDVTRGRRVSSSSFSAAAQRVASAPPQPTRDNAASNVEENGQQTLVTKVAVSSVTPRPKVVARSATMQVCSPVKSPAPKFGSVVRSASARFANASAPVVFTNTSASNAAGNAVPCGEFTLDMASTQFGMCKCGFDRNAHARKNLNGGLSESFRIYTLDQLKSRKATGNFGGLDPLRLECFLEEREFQKAFGMDPEQFRRLPGWKQKDVKKAAGIF